MTTDVVLAAALTVAAGLPAASLVVGLALVPSSLPQAIALGAVTATACALATLTALRTRSAHRIETEFRAGSSASMAPPLLTGPGGAPDHQIVPLHPDAPTNVPALQQHPAVRRTRTAAHTSSAVPAQSGACTAELVLGRTS